MDLFVLALVGLVVARCLYGLAVNFARYLRSVENDTSIDV